ncbi:MAG: hypothetical protein ABII89_06190 [Candidatus Omnitrophota bacterium]
MNNIYRCEEPEFYGKKYNPRGDTWQEIDRLRRTIGSRRQKLVSVSKNGFAEDKKLFGGTDFYLLKHAVSGELAFSKKINSGPQKQMREFHICENVSHQHIIKLLEVNKKYGLVFPYLPWTPLERIDFDPVKNAREFKLEVEKFFEFAERTQIETGMLDFEPGAGGQKRMLCELVDIHPNNFLVLIEDNLVKNWVVIDTEYCSNDNRVRNEKHKKRIMERVNPDRRLQIFRNWFKKITWIINNCVLNLIKK